MYLKSLKINNFRKFGTKNNIIEFVDSKDSLLSTKINVACASSLIVGQNNSGKTTIIKALHKVVKDKKFSSNDFNFSYLTELLESYKQKQYKLKPFLEFEILIGIDEKKHEDIMHNFAPFISIKDCEDGIKEKDFKIIIKYELKDDVLFFKEIRTLILEKNNLFGKFLKLLDNKDLFSFNYYKENGKQVKNLDFNINNLIKISVINPNENQDDKALSTIFSKIIQNKYEIKKEKLEDDIEQFNINMTKDISEKYTKDINDVVHQIHDQKDLKVSLSADLSFENLINSLIKYEYSENNMNIPESQFGLGYRNLMRIIGQLIDYVEHYPEDEKHSKLNIICIEEPEVFMHPQMQELFISHVNKAIGTLLKNSKKKLNTQLIISTHSAHILNSKIHTSKSFDNINYIYEKDNLSNVVNLNDSKIILNEKIKATETEKEKEKRIKNDLKFIKKHIKFKASELFFADAVIFVEGITEEVLLSYFIGENSVLNKKYITIFNINGAHGLVYHHLIKTLAIPTIVITDLDIKRTSPKKANFTQIDSLKYKVTTNQTIIKYNKTPLLKNIPNYFIDCNLYIAFQSKKIKGFYATSLEESFILANYDNQILNDALSKTKRNEYLKIIGKDKNMDNLIKESYKLQKKLTDSKSDFANELLYQFSIHDDNKKDLPILPNYISDALKWLENEFKTSQSEG